MSKEAASGSKATLWTGRALSTLAVLFLLADGVAKLVKPRPVVVATLRLGFSEAVIPFLGVLLTLCALIYAFPSTAAVGAILLTGYLGGAMAVQIRAGATPFPVFFPCLAGLLVWGGLWLREPRLRSLVPWRR